MRAYTFDQDGFLLGDSPCQVDPLESERQGKTVFLLPGSSTTQEPPGVNEGQRVRWTGSLWIVEEIPAEAIEREVNETEQFPHIPADAKELNAGTEEPIEP